jgi:hypothetical protein
VSGPAEYQEIKAETAIPVEVLRVNIERALKAHRVRLGSEVIDELLAEIRDSLYVALVAQAGRVEGLESAAHDERLVGLVPGTVRWLSDRAAELRHEGRPWLTKRKQDQDAQ